MTARRPSVFWLGLVIASLLVAPLVGGDAVAGATATPYKTNLVIDPGAELAVGADGYVVVPIPGWTLTSNFTATPYGASGFPTISEGARIGGGALFFTGGADNTSSSASQRITLVGRSRVIDRGRVKVRVTAWLAGWDGQPDTAQVILRFLRADGSLISAIRTAAVSATSEVFVKKSASKVAPIGTRKLEVVLAAKRGAGAYNDGYFDTIDVRLLPI